MIRAKVTILAALAVQLSLVLPALAGGPHGGGGGGGGPHPGGGGPHPGGGGPHPGFNGYYHGGYYHGYYPGWYNRGYYPYGYGFFFGIDFSLYDYGYPPPYPYPPLVPAPLPPLVPPPDPSVGPPAAPASAPPVPNTGLVHVLVPEDAELWFDGTPLGRKGAERDFITPALTPGQTYTYKIRARWVQDGQPRDKSLDIQVQANRLTTVDFRPPPRLKD